MTLTEDEFKDWKEHYVTQEFFKLLKLKREVFKENLINDLYENEEYVKGKASALQELIEMQHEDMMEELHGERVWNPT